MRRALLVGINDYPGCPLQGCEPDASRLDGLLRTHADGSPNFDCRVLLSSCEPVTRARLREALGELFSKPADTALFYFSGHGSEHRDAGILVTQDYSTHDLGLPMEEVIKFAAAAQSRIQETFIVLDCCHSGYAGQSWVAPNLNVLPRGVSILTASSGSEPAFEANGAGVFTSLVCAALDGGAADVLGKVTAASIYSYLDQTLGAWDQRPHFKANLSRLADLRHCVPTIAPEFLRQLTKIFPRADHQLALSPAYEPTAEPRDHDKERIFAVLQKYRAARLLVPVGADHLYYAAIDSKACELTPLGRFYWELVRRGKL